MRKILTLAALLALTATGAQAEVVERHADGFTLRMSAPVAAGWAQAFFSVGDVDHWWNADHTYSGDAANLSLPLQPGACFCEAMPDGSTFEHGRIAAMDQRREIRLEAPLGPLKGLTTRADLVFGWNNTIGGDQVLTLTYVVEGEGLGAYADPVDQVLTDQFGRWAAWAPRVALRPAPLPRR